MVKYVVLTRGKKKSSFAFVDRWGRISDRGRTIKPISKSEAEKIKREYQKIYPEWRFKLKKVL